MNIPKNFTEDKLNNLVTKTLSSMLIEEVSATIDSRVITIKIGSKQITIYKYSNTNYELSWSNGSVSLHSLKTNQEEIKYAIVIGAIANRFKKSDFRGDLDHWFELRKQVEDNKFSGLKYDYYIEQSNTPERKITLSQALAFADKSGFNKDKAEELLHDDNIGEIVCENGTRIWSEEAMKY